MDIKLTGGFQWPSTAAGVELRPGGGRYYTVIHRVKHFEMTENGHLEMTFGDEGSFKDCVKYCSAYELVADKPLTVRAPVVKDHQFPNGVVLLGQWAYTGLEIDRILSDYRILPSNHTPPRNT
jgi:hypothetical protein